MHIFAVDTESSMDMKRLMDRRMEHGHEKTDGQADGQTSLLLYILKHSFGEYNKIH